MPDMHTQGYAGDGADEARPAPGTPGEPAHWAPAGKTGVGTALNPVSPVWFTLGRGVVTEVYYPFVDTACTRSLGLLVADGKDFFSDEECDATSEVHYLTPGVPAYRLVNTCKQSRYRIEKDVLSDPRRPVLLQEVRFTPRQGRPADYRVYALLNPHIGNRGSGNTAWAGDFKGVPMLFARRAGIALALACSPPWQARSVGFVGTSDGRRDVSRHRKLTERYDRAEDGNVALTGEVDLETDDGRFVLALGFGRNEWEAGHQARAALLQGFPAARKEYVRGWSRWLKGLLYLEGSRQHPQDVYRISAAVMRVHEAKFLAGGIIASLAVPWGPARGDGDMGYHVVWPRDMIQTVAALLAVWGHEDARRVLFYFRVTQEADGHWPQNMRLDGEAWWRGIQLDETAFVILLVGLARREKAIDDEALKYLWPMVRRAAGYLVRHGPVTPMDRWEEVPGYYVSTLAVEVAALLVAADIADEQGEPAAAYLRETADAWNDSIERMLYVTGTDLARRAGVDGYYVRFAGPGQREAPSPAYGDVPVVNHPRGERTAPAASIVSPDALTLVRFGLRAADDPRVVNTVRVIDLLCKADTPCGPCWHRYNDDGYGEHADGSPFDGTGVGRLWPLLAGERGHYELAAGRRDEAERLVRAMEGFANDSGLLPEQVWDSDDIPERGLYKGRPTGSAMPLVWAHAEYVKLRRSLHDGRGFDTPEATAQRYLRDKVHSPHFFWRIDQKCRSMPAGKVLRVELKDAALVRWSADGWASSRESPTRDTGLGIHVVDLPTAKLPPGADVVFTFHWTEAKRWQGEDFHVRVENDGG